MTSCGLPRNRDADQTLTQIAKDFGIAESCLANWIKKADIEDGNKPGTTAAENTELREARTRIRLLEQQNEVLRRAAAYRPRRTSRENDVPRSSPSWLSTGSPSR